MLFCEVVCKVGRLFRLFIAVVRPVAFCCKVGMVLMFLHAVILFCEVVCKVGRLFRLFIAFFRSVIFCVARSVFVVLFTGIGASLMFAQVILLPDPVQVEVQVTLPFVTVVPQVIAEFGFACNAA